MLDAARVLVDRHPVVHGVRLGEPSRVLGRAEAQEVPGRLHERVHGVRLAPSWASAARARRVHEPRHVGEGRAPLPRDLDVLREHYGETLGPLGHRPAPRTVDDRDRRAPVPLATDAPVAEPVVHLPNAAALGDEPVDRLAFGLGDREVVEEAGVDLHPVPGIGLALPARRPLDGLDDGEPVRLGEVPVPLVLAGNGHDGAGAVAHEDVVGEEQRELDPGEGVHRPRLEPEAPLRLVRGQALDLALPTDLGPEGRDGLALLGVGDELVHERMLRREDGVGHAEGRVGPGREDANRQAGSADHGEIELGAFALADPVALHREDALRPADEAVTPLEELLRVRRDLEVPALDLPVDDLGVAAPAPARLHLLVGQHGLAPRAPVHAGALLVREPALEHLDEDQLLPPVVLGVARRDLALPVVGDPERPHLSLHRGDVLVRPHRRVDPVVDGRVLGRSPKASQPIGWRTLKPRLRL